MKIRCTHCNQVFDLSEDMASHIRDQIRTAEFEKELEERTKLIQESSDLASKSKVMEAMMEEKAKFEKALNKANNEVLEAKTKAVEAKAALESEQKKHALELEKIRLDVKAEFSEKISDMELTMRTQQQYHELAIEKAKMDAKEEFSEKISEMESSMKAIEHERDYYKDLKSKMSTKMVGETLEQHCEIEFNKIRMAAFPRAEFGKDNVVSKETGSKGDYIFREYDADGIEIISIMFEMKNQMETTATKKTNEHFFKELDKDRKEKKCEYAVLVSLLEEDNELYNQGIVDVSYRYDKMYVVRPQFFIPIITLLRNAALSSHDDRRELIRVQNQNLDVANFKNNFEAFKKGFSYNYMQAGKRLNEAVEEIDKAIARLEAVKASLTASDKQFTQANKKAEEITIEKLCKGSPLMLEEFKRFDNE